MTLRAPINRNHQSPRTNRKCARRGRTMPTIKTHHAHSLTRRWRQQEQKLITRASSTRRPGANRQQCMIIERAARVFVNNGGGERHLLERRVSLLRPPTRNIQKWPDRKYESGCCRASSPRSILWLAGWRALPTSKNRAQ